MNNSDIVIQNILNRRTIKPEQCTGANIPDADIWKILEAANWAPTHGYTEPWRFMVYTGEAKYTFSKAHAEMYKAAQSAESFRQIAYDKIMERASLTSHIIVYVNKKGANPKIPLIEELQSTAMAVQNMTLVAQAMGYAAYINSGAMTYTPQMKAYLGIGEEDQVLGVLYLGVPNDEEKAPGRRITPIEDKVVWNK